MKQSIFIAMVLSFGITEIKGQTLSEKIELENVIAEFDSRGYLFSTNYNSLESGFEYPKGSNNSTIFASSFWISAVDSISNSLHTSINTYPISHECIFAGPIRNAPYSDLSRNGIFKVNKSTVIDFSQNYGSPGYIIPSPIINWPGNGNINSGMTERLAPFYDFNTNGAYEPIVNGDYPLVLGEENLYFIYNDKSGSRSGFNSAVSSLDIELKSYAYSLEKEYEVFKDCIFLNTVIKNRSANTYKDVYLGLWFDFDIGGSSDDHIGCDSSLNIFYSYNADDLDDDYNSDIPAQGVMVLNHPLNSFIGYNNSTNAINGNPQDITEINNYLRGYWKNGNDISASGNGTDSIGAATTKFLFNYGINQETGPGTDKRALGNIGPFSLSPNESICFDWVVFPAIDTNSATAFSSVVQLLNKADTIKKLFDIVGIGCNFPLISGNRDIDKQINESGVLVYPNPSRYKLNISSPDIYEKWSLELIDLSNGKTIYKKRGSGNITQSINLERYAKGFYLLQIQTDQSVENFKILIDA